MEGVKIFLHPFSLFLTLPNKFFCCHNELIKNVFKQNLLIMAGIEIVTKQDLIELEERLISEIRKTNGTVEEPKKLLKSYQVKNLLKISPGTLQNLRVNGTLPFTKVGGIIYYNYEDIMKIFDPAKEKTKGGR